MMILEKSQPVKGYAGERRLPYHGTLPAKPISIPAQTPFKNHDPILTTKKACKNLPATPCFYWWAVRDLNPRPPVCENDLGNFSNPLMLVWFSRNLMKFKKT